MDLFAAIAERKIKEAMARGEFVDLPGAGRPLPPDDLASLPAELRMAYRVLKNAGCLPPEVEAHREIVTLKNLIATLEESDERRRRLKELNFKLVRFSAMRRRPLYLDDPCYGERLTERLTGGGR